MLIFKDKTTLAAYLKSLRRQGKKIGFVPTMGALHEGHLSLMKEASTHADVVICSIFVNPTQFNDRKDFEKYPIRREDDIKKLLGSPTELLFLPSVEEIYGPNTVNLETYDFGKIEKMLEGVHRPGHFQGVGQVMRRLLELIQPEVLLMGQKDYQQVLIINTLINILKINAQLIICPIVREPDGLAMSSRNLRLTEEARRKASGIYQTLVYIKDNYRRSPFDKLVKKGINFLEKQGFQVEYLTIANSRDLQVVNKPVSSPMICLAAAWLDGIRLIDNVFL
ncbi:MAG: pantoate--beta-alanine ligase [Chitinophagaceae bacterium]|nr:MAG: pantoate--beta-alanine ligase [Chitinophagaceae bacterium]